MVRKSLFSSSLLFIAVVVLCAAVAACSPLRTINALTPETTCRRINDLSFGNGARDKLNIYVPNNITGTVPVVVFFYGGNWNSGSRKDYKFVGEAMASRGILAVVADYRLYPEVRYPAFLKDSAAAVAWVARHVRAYGGDPERLFVMGHSAGAYGAAMVALDDRWLAHSGLSPAILRGWIGLAGPYEFLPVTNLNTRPVFLYPDTPLDSQPVRHVTGKAPPSLLIAPKNDQLVDPHRNTGGLANALRQAGAPVDDIYLDWTSHTSLVGSLARPLRVLAPTLDLVERFIKTDGGRLGTQAMPTSAALPVAPSTDR